MGENKSGSTDVGRVKHSHKAFLVFVGLAFFVVFVVGIILILVSNKDERVQQNPIQTELQTDEEAAIEAADLLLEDETTEEAKEKLRTLADDQFKSPESREVALNALIDQCYLESNILCIEDLKDDLKESEFSTELADIYIADIQEFIDNDGQQPVNYVGEDPIFEEEYSEEESVSGEEPKIETVVTDDLL